MLVEKQLGTKAGGILRYLIKNEQLELTNVPQFRSHHLRREKYQRNRGENGLVDDAYFDSS